MATLICARKLLSGLPRATPRRRPFDGQPDDDECGSGGDVLIFLFPFFTSRSRRTLTDTAADCSCTVLFAAATAPLLFTTTFYLPPPPPDNNARESMSPADKTRPSARLTTAAAAPIGKWWPSVADGSARARIQSL